MDDRELISTLEARLKIVVDVFGRFKEWSVTINGEGSGSVGKTGERMKT